jgi:hypothetical protein
LLCKPGVIKRGFWLEAIPELKSVSGWVLVIEVNEAFPAGKSEAAQHGITDRNMNKTHTGLRS